MMILVVSISPAFPWTSSISSSMPNLDSAYASEYHVIESEGQDYENSMNVPGGYLATQMTLQVPYDLISQSAFSEDCGGSIDCIAKVFSIIEFGPVVAVLLI